MRISVLALIILLITACTSDPAHWNTGDAHAVVKPTTTYGADYEVQLRNYENDDINIVSRVVRHDILADVMKEYCPDGYNIQQEVVVPEGLLTEQGRRKNYYIYTQCK